MSRPVTPPWAGGGGVQDGPGMGTAAVMSCTDPGPARETCQGLRSDT